MKKTCLFFANILLCMMSLSFVGCNRNLPQQIDLAEVPVGTNIPFYPSQKFECEVQSHTEEKIIFHIDSIQATLHRYNKIEPNVIVEANYCRFEIEISISGATLPTLANQHFILVTSIGSFSIYDPILIKSDGTFNGASIVDYSSRYISDISFEHISLV